MKKERRGSNFSQVSRGQGRDENAPNDEFYMQKAMELSVLGRPSPNPYVGAVIVKEGKVIGAGFHKKAGEPHAEIEAINDVKRKFGKEAKKMLDGATLYVTLEPCNHFGKTPPCTDAILKEGIGSVVCSMRDENPNVPGGGVEKLQEAGLIVEVGALENKVRALNAPFFKHMKTGMPLVTLKMAMSLDGKTATKTGDSKWISGEESRLVVHKMRDKVGAVMVGIGTVLADNPHLTCRVEGGRNPLRVIVDSKLRIPLDSNIFFDKNVIIACMQGADEAGRRKLEDRKIQVVQCPPCAEGKIDLEFLLKKIGKMGINHLMCEGGAELAAELLKKDLVDEIALFVAPKIIGGERRGVFAGMEVLNIGDAKKVKMSWAEFIGEDLLMVARSGWMDEKAAKGLYGPLGISLKMI